MTGQPLQCIDTGSQVCNLAWSKGANELVSTHGYSQNQIIIWRYPSLTQVARLTGHTTRVLYLVRNSLACLYLYMYFNFSFSWVQLHMNQNSIYACVSIFPLLVQTCRLFPLMVRRWWQVLVTKHSGSGTSFTNQSPTRYNQAAVLRNVTVSNTIHYLHW